MLTTGVGEIKAVYVGGVAVSKVFAGDQLVWPHGVKPFAVKLDGEPFALAVTGDGRKVYVLDMSSTRVWVFDTNTNRVVNVLTLPSLRRIVRDRNWFCVATNDSVGDGRAFGNRVYVTDGYGAELAVIDCDTDAVSVYRMPMQLCNGIALSPDDSVLYMCGESVDGSGLVKVDLETFEAVDVPGATRTAKSATQVGVGVFAVDVATFHQLPGYGGGLPLDEFQAILDANFGVCDHIVMYLWGPPGSSGVGTGDVSLVHPTFGVTPLDGGVGLQVDFDSFMTWTRNASVDMFIASDVSGAFISGWDGSGIEPTVTQFQSNGVDLFIRPESSRRDDILFYPGELDFIEFFSTANRQIRLLPDARWLGLGFGVDEDGNLAIIDEDYLQTLQYAERRGGAIALHPGGERLFMTNLAGYLISYPIPELEVINPPEPPPITEVGVVPFVELVTFTNPGQSATRIPDGTTHFDVVVLGAGGGAGQGLGPATWGSAGSPGEWGYRRFGAGQFAVGEQIVASVGKGGAAAAGSGLVAGVAKDGGDTKVTFRTTTVTGAGGAGGPLIGAGAQPPTTSPGSKTYDGYTYAGGAAATAVGAPGNAPGGGGAPQKPPLIGVSAAGGAGATGKVWIRFFGTKPA